MASSLLDPRNPYRRLLYQSIGTPCEKKPRLLRSKALWDAQRQPKFRLRPRIPLGKELAISWMHRWDWQILRKIMAMERWTRNAQRPPGRDSHGCQTEQSSRKFSLTRVSGPASRLKDGVEKKRNALRPRPVLSPITRYRYPGRHARFIFEWRYDTKGNGM
jgi:hypothetical protein